MPTRRYYKDTRFEHYRTFSRATLLGSYAAAGRELGLSRPTVWQQIDTLEQDLGVKLFARAGRGVEATAEGRVLLELVQPSVAAFDSLRAAFRARLADAGGTLRLAVIQGGDLDRAILRYRREHPCVHLTLTEHRSINVLRMMAVDAFDLGLAMASPEMLAGPLVHFEPIGRRSFTLVTPAGHPLTRSRRVRLADVVKHPLITFSRDNPFRLSVDRAFERAGLRGAMRVAIEVDTVETADHFVQLGLGVGIVLAVRDKPLLPRIAYRPLEHLIGQMPLYLLWKKGTHLLPHVAGFVRVVKECPPQPYTTSGGRDDENAVGCGGS